MRLITLLLVLLVVLIQYPLWLGKGGRLRVHELERQVQIQNKTNADLRARNDKLSAEVRDLKEGAGAVEERARYELGMIKDGEVFVQIVDPPHPGDAKEAISSGDPEALQKPPSGVAPSPNGSTSANPAMAPKTTASASGPRPAKAAGPVTSSAPRKALRE
jgi:cell division protein FtsB